MTIEGAIVELQNLIKADDVPFYYDGVIKKVIETIIDECKPTTGAKMYEMPNDKYIIFAFDENGIGKITLEAMDRMMEMINIDLVRCGECIYHDDGLCHRPKWSFAVEPTDSCNKGERRADE